MKGGSHGTKREIEGWAHGGTLTVFWRVSEKKRGGTSILKRKKGDRIQNSECAEGGEGKG